MQRFLITAALALGLAAPALAQTPAAPAEAVKPAAAKLTSDSTITDLVANEKSRAIMEKHLPIIVQYADMIPDGMTLKQLSQMDEAKSVVTPEAVKAVEDDLAKL